MLAALAKYEVLPASSGGEKKQILFDVLQVTHEQIKGNQIRR